MSFREVVCPNCMKNIPIDSNRSNNFCIYCGKELSFQDELAENSNLTDENQSTLEELFEEGKYNYLLNVTARSIKEEQGGIEENIYYLLAKMCQSYNEYHEESCKDNSGKNGLMRILTNFSKVGSSSTAYHEKFLSNIKKTSDELYQMLSDGKENQGVLCQSAAEKATNILIKWDLTHFPTAEAISYEMLEKFAIPFFTLLSNNDLDSQFQFYKDNRKKRFFGKEVFSALKDEKAARRL